jgi:Lrp/AsnC family leucine-responsive transcriptional regulator
MTSHASDLDRIDLKILAALAGRRQAAQSETGRAVALSPTAVLARTQRLTREGYILGYEARLNPLKLGRGMMVFVEVLLDKTTPNVFEQFKAAVQVQPAIMECHMVAGGFDYLLKTRMADMAGLPRLCRHRVVAAARRARDTHLCRDGRGEVHHPAAGLIQQRPTRHPSAPPDDTCPE